MTRKLGFFETVRADLPQAIIGFYGRYAWLANEYAVQITFDGVTYPSVAHAFAASGTNDLAIRRRISEEPSPLGVRTLEKRAVPNYTTDLDRVDTLAQLLILKFSDTGLRAKLLETGKALLVNKNERGDTVWGVCNQSGFNFLGKVLMALRERLAEEVSRTYSDGKVRK